MNDSASYRAGYVALVGEPNVGKSTLMNAILNQKISIISRKPQTTRQRVLGILSRADVQIVFLDTPGLLKPQYLLQQRMMQFAERALADADVVVLLSEVSNGAVLPDIVRSEVLKIPQKPVIMALNKVDTIPRAHVLPLIEQFAQEGIFKEIVPLSALKQENVEELIQTLVRYLPVHPPYYPPDIVSEHPERFFVAEFIREKIFEEFRDEVPYSTAVEIREFKERTEGRTYISADIIVERESQKGIVIGKDGSALKKIGQRSRKEIEDFLNRAVYLDLHVKARAKWRKNDQWLRKFGYSTE